MTTQQPRDDGDMIDRLDAGDPPSSPEEAEARAPYVRLIQLIRELEDAAPPAGWEKRSADRWSAARARRRKRSAVGVAAGVGLAVAILLPLCLKRTAERAFQVAISERPGVRRHVGPGDHAVGDVLHARAPVDQTHVELRVYLSSPRADRLIVRCPGSEPCRRAASSIEVDWTLTEPGVYRVVKLSSDSAIPPPTDGTIDRDLLEVRDAGAHSEIEVVKVVQ